MNLHHHDWIIYLFYRASLCSQPWPLTAVELSVKNWKEKEAEKKSSIQASKAHPVESHRQREETMSYKKNQLAEKRSSHDKVSRIRKYLHAQKLKKENRRGKKKDWRSEKTQVEFLEIKKITKVRNTVTITSIR